MNKRFELICRADGKFLFQLRGDDGNVLLSSHTCDSKIMAQSEVLQARNSLRDVDRLVAEQAGDGTHYYVVKDRKGSVLAKSPVTASADEFAGLSSAIRTAAQNAPLVDLTKHRSAG